MSKRVGFSLLVLAVVLVFAVGSKTACAIQIPVGDGISFIFGDAQVFDINDRDIVAADESLGLDLEDAVKIDFGNSYVYQASGVFASVGFGFTDPAVFQDLEFDPFVAEITSFWTASSQWAPGGANASFDLESMSITQQDSENLDLHGSGMLHLDGYEATMASWSLQIDHHTEAIFLTMTSTTSAVPEPGTIALLGIGLAGLVGVGMRKRAKNKIA